MEALNNSLRRSKPNYNSNTFVPASGRQMGESSCMSWLVPLLVLVGICLLIYLMYNYSNCGRRSYSDDNSNSNSYSNGNSNINGIYVISNMTNGNNKAQTDVIDIDGDQLEQLSNQQPIVVAFFAQGCHWCVKAKPEYANAAKSAARQLYTLHAHSKNGMDQCKKHGVKGFPTILYVHKGRVIAEYSGDRSAADIAKWSKTLK
jgi:thiol-disulfide isomerase/thioredoxin